MKALLIVTAVIEMGAGLGLLTVPSLVREALLGSSPATAAELTISRLAAMALTALALACWLLRNEGGSRAMKGLVIAMMLYNFGATGVLLYAGLGLRSSGVAFWPGVLVHVAMGVWCILALLHKPARMSAGK